MIEILYLRLFLGLSGGVGIGYLLFGLPWRHSGGLWLGEHGGGFWLGKRRKKRDTPGEIFIYYSP